MKYGFLWCPTWRTAADTPNVPPSVYDGLTPRVIGAEEGGLWVDVWGLDPKPPLRAIVRHLRETGALDIRVAVGDVPIALEVIARGRDTAYVEVEAGTEAQQMAELPVGLLRPGRRTATLLEGVGILRVGALAALDASAVETRFGAAGVALWHLARGRDGRRPFAPADVGMPTSEADLTAAPATTAEEIGPALRGGLEDVLQALTRRGRVARALRVELGLEGGGHQAVRLIPSRATADIEWYHRLGLREIDQRAIPDRVISVRVAVDGVLDQRTRQGELFDDAAGGRAALEAFLARARETWGDVIVEPPSGQDTSPDSGPLPLHFAVLDPPEPIRVEASGSGGEGVPAMFRIAHDMYRVIEVEGPTLTAGGQWSSPHARTEYRCLTECGRIAVLSRCGLCEGWYLRGWWT